MVFYVWVVSGLVLLCVVLSVVSHRRRLDSGPSLAQLLRHPAGAREAARIRHELGYDPLDADHVHLALREYAHWQRPFLVHVSLGGASLFGLLLWFSLTTPGARGPVAAVLGAVLGFGAAYGAGRALRIHRRRTAASRAFRTAYRRVTQAVWTEAEPD
ncbi:hypothetical protein JOF53_005754 [Crossiella equi]|uniref:Uncharacterized protein n=1 Tax=Crossiella equi TaxID=130796 RepID=A0ABS5AKU3_9PSEU|nr:hypothetical protein [Crossiella equi]MBP2476882.1 hypothetical protein [Crossiella equi]